ncbi:MAG: HAMP domain-containing histidine kinase [bacterium]|nr:MAG: HAMP domain-containing histidine kinase [bacterium]
MKVSRNLPFLLRVYFILGSIILVTLALYYNHTLIRRMRAQAEDMTRLFSRFIAIELRDVTDMHRYAFIREVRNAINLPFVLTDAGGRPVIWNQIGIDMPSGEKLYTRVLDFDPTAPKDPMLEKVYMKAHSFDRINAPIRIEIDNTFLLIHYGPSKLARELAVAPYIQLAVFVAFVLFGFLGFRAMKIGEQRSIWVGMAKETAHQLGTPLSSIMGWITMIREDVGETGCSEKLAQAIDETAADVERLGKISSRFSKIGSMPKLEFHELAPIIEETVDYFERRRPSLKIHSTISVELEELPLIRCSKDLLSWVFENLIKNSIDAIAGDAGKIHITGGYNKSEKRVEITFSDNGKGMSSGVRSRIFSPGFTTKDRGWGLGLALVKRILEEIHHGTIKVVNTQPGKGTTFLITLPVG